MSSLAPCASPWPRRPFSASDDRGGGGGSLLTVLVLLGRHVDPPGVALPPLAGVFVAASIQSGASTAASADPLTVLPLYEQRGLPFSTTRVAALSAAVWWNEMLALSLPDDWRAAGGELTLRIDLVARAASQQEDWLLASLERPLAAVVARSNEQQLAVWALVPSLAHSGSSPTVFVALQEHSRAFPDPRQPSAVRLELLVQSFSLAAGSPSRLAALPAWLAALVSVRTDSSASSAPERHGKSLDAAFLSPSSSDEEGRVAVTAFSPVRSRLSGSSCDWRFPMGFQLDAAASEVVVELFGGPEAAGSELKPVGGGVLDLDALASAATRSLLTKHNGAAVQLPPIAISAFEDGRQTLVGHLHVRARVWDAASWQQFVREMAARRVVCSNRPAAGLGALQTPPEWLGAVLRGLNRHPVSSFCDEGGVTGVLAALLGESRGSGGPLDAPVGPPEEGQGGGVISQLLRDQVVHLTSEAAAQRQQIERLQLDLDARLDAVKTCGLEMVALRRELQAKDERIAHLQAQLDAATRREQQQTAVLMKEAVADGGELEGDRTSRRLRALAAKYAELEQEHQVTARELETAQQSAVALLALETRHSELQEAHVVQAALVQRLQRDKQQSETLRRAVRVQEKVIRQFEQAVAMQPAPAPAAISPRPPPRSQAGQQTRDEAAEVRVRVLEQQLERNARAAAAEISALRLRVAELELAAGREHNGRRG